QAGDAGDSSRRDHRPAQARLRGASGLVVSRRAVGLRARSAVVGPLQATWAVQRAISRAAVPAQRARARRGPSALDDRVVRVVVPSLPRFVFPRRPSRTGGAPGAASDRSTGDSRLLTQTLLVPGASYLVLGPIFNEIQTPRGGRGGEPRHPGRPGCAGRSAGG